MDFNVPADQTQVGRLCDDGQLDITSSSSALACGAPRPWGGGKAG